MEKIWEKVRSKLREDLPQQVFEPLIAPLEALSGPTEGDGRLVLGTSRPDHLSELQAKFSGPIRLKLQSLMGRDDVAVEFRLEAPAGKVRAAPERPGPFFLNPAYTLERMVRGRSNELSLLAAERIIAGGHYQGPLIVYGPVGIGKTHFTHGLMHGLLKRPQPPSISRLSLAEARQEVSRTGCIRFKARHTRSDLLYIQDLHLLNGNEPLCDEFAVVFNSCYDAGRMLLLTSELPLVDLRLPQRLRSRMGSGLQLELQAPDLALRRAFLAERSAKLGVTLPDEVRAFLTERFSEGLPILEAALLRLRLAQKTATTLSAQNVGTILQDMLPPAPTGPLSLESIMRVVCDHFGVAEQDIRGSSRKSEFTLPRHTAMYLAVRYSELNKSAIARFFRKNDHSTVINAEKNIRRRIEREAGFQRILDELTTRLVQKHRQGKPVDN